MRFTIQQHHARRAGIHWDLRLQVDDQPVMKSFAIPKAKLPDFGEKIRAIPVADHALSYQDFQGEITEGYGKGEVYLVANGDYELVKFDGNFKIRLPGFGLFKMVKMKDNNFLVLRLKEEK